MSNDAITGADFKLNAGNYQVSGPAAKEAGCKPKEVLLFGIDKKGDVSSQQCTEQKKGFPLFNSLDSDVADGYYSAQCATRPIGDSPSNIGLEFNNGKLNKANQERELGLYSEDHYGKW